MTVKKMLRNLNMNIFNPIKRPSLTESFFENLKLYRAATFFDMIHSIMPNMMSVEKSAIKR